MSAMNQAVQEIDFKIAQLQSARATLIAVMGGGPATTRRGAAGGEVRTRKPMSEESKAKIRAAQAKRWKKTAEAAATAKAGLTVPEKPAGPAAVPDKAKSAEAGKPADKK